jgi:hypothetical protein
VTRALDWEGCLNVRDLGGVARENGGETRYGVLFRADNLGRLTPGGWRRGAEEYLRGGGLDEARLQRLKDRLVAP